MPVSNSVDESYMRLFCFFVIAVLSLSACSDRPSPASGAVVGGVSGAAVGSIVGHDLGSTAAGTAIGAAAGAGVGAVVGSQSNDKQQILDQQQDIIVTQQEEMRRQGKEIDQIKRQQYWDQRLQQHQ